jgi:vitamin B12 transporter
MSKKQLLFIALVISAQFSIAQDSIKVSSLDEVVFTSSKYPRKQSETGKVITVIGRDQLERSTGRSIGEILNTIAGTTIIGSNNNLGSNQTVSIRGGSSGNALILLNGIPVNDPSINTNYFDLNFIATDQVERIEILKGGQSTLYGSDAVMGVINIITKKTNKEGAAVTLNALAGSFGTFKGNASLQQRGKRSLASLHYNYMHSDGFSAAVDSAGSNNFDRDGFDLHALTGSYQFDINAKLQWNLFGQYGNYKTDLDASGFNDEKDYTVKNYHLQTGAGLLYKITDGDVRVNYRYHFVRRDYEDDSTFKSSPWVDYSKSRYDGRTHYAEAYANKRYDKFELLAGVDYRKNITDQNALYISSFGESEFGLSDSIARSSQISPYASVILKPTASFNFEIGGRWNNHSEYGSNFTYTLNPSLLLKKKVKLFANLYSAFKTPTLYQLFDPSIGNTELEAEKSVIIESGLQYFGSDGFAARGLYFHRRTEDAIQYVVVDPATFESQYRNVGDQTNNGVELELEYVKSNWNVRANYTHTQGKLQTTVDEAGGQLGKDSTINNLYRVPKDVVNLTAGWNITKTLYVQATARIAGSRLEPIYASTPVELDGYHTIDLYTEYRVNRRVKVYVDAKNLTDQEYFEVLGYNTRRFNIYGGVQVSF